MKPAIEIKEPPADESGMEFFVSVIDDSGQKRGLLLGPFPSHAEALANVDRGRKLAERHDARAVFYGFGTAGAPVGHIKKTVFGV
jgi:hypothetical protein